VILAAAAARTRRIRLNSAVTVLSAADPVRVFQQFATLDLLSHGRAEIVAGRGSFIEAFPLFGLDLNDYDSLFAEKLELLLKLREHTHVRWSGQHRASLTGQAVYPRRLQNQLPVWLGVGGTPDSFVRAGTLGLPLMVAIIGGEPHRFRPLIDLYRKAGLRAGHALEQLRVGVHALGYVAEDAASAAEDFFPIIDAAIRAKVPGEPHLVSFSPSLQAHLAAVADEIRTSAYSGGKRALNRGLRKQCYRLCSCGHACRFNFSTNGGPSKQRGLHRH